MNQAQERELKSRLQELESLVDALRGHEIDAVVGTDKVLMLRLREAEQALAESEAWLRVVSDAGGIGLLGWDVQTDNTRCNDTFREMIGRCSDISFTFDEWLDLIHPDDRARVDATIAQALNAGNSCGFDCQVQAGDDTRWLEYHGKLERDVEGRPTRMLGAIRDVTRRKYVEVELESANRKMELRIAERTRMLQRQTIQLRKLAAQAMSSEHRERKRLAALLHDHLQQYLVAAKIQLHFVQQSTHVEKRQEAVRKSIRLMEESIELARSLSRELRPPVLYEAGFIAAVRWLSNEMRHMHTLKVSVTAADDAEPVGDDLKSLLFECVRELLFNVVKYANTPEAAVELARKSATIIQITVSDEGVGFDPAQFSNNDRPGVGLLRCRERLASIGGAIEIISQPGEGTRVVLRAPADLSFDPLPIRDGQTVQQTSGIIDPNSPDDRIRVLIVDDHVIVREGIAAMVEGPIMTVVAQASDGMEAIEIIESCHPQVILMDLNMPRMNGIEATKAIRGRWPDVAIIALSVQDDQATAQSLKDAGADAFVPKSHGPNALFEAILGVI